ncbi:uncharacterized protein LOC132701272 [Cylas formicarius]|uniref:uncharacterized protein LOC132701272 n=1 Tax=Cylas formicarius TaxID=197179 RepID=UPI002958B7F8|nr:uncharacterized protein LOC132701272 [Cylas formicarius]
MEIPVIMDHDSGYVEALNQEEYVNNFSLAIPSIYFNEDALLEKPDTLTEQFILPKEIDDKDNEEARGLLFTPDKINSSVQSAQSVYSGLEGTDSSVESDEIPVGSPIIAYEEASFNLSQPDMSLEETALETVIIECCTEDRKKSSSEKGFIFFSKEQQNFQKPCLELGAEEGVNNSSLLKKNNSCCNDAADNDKDLEIIPVCDDTTPSIKRKKSFSNPYGDGNIKNGQFLSTTIPKEKRRLTLIFSKTEDNSFSVKRKHPSLGLTPEKKYENPIISDMSPDIFGDDQIKDEDKKCFSKNLSQIKVSSPNLEKYMNTLDEKLIKRVQKGISGVLPPPSVTVVNISASEILNKLKENKQYFWNENCVKNTQNTSSTKDCSLETNMGSIIGRSLLTNIASIEQIPFDKFPAVLEYRYHGLHHNCSSVSEEIEALCEKYAKRFVGAETQSSCTVFEPPAVVSPSKRKMLKPKWNAKSPGRRLSHLARRRITFSSANLQAGGSSLAGLRARQILVDGRKMELLNRHKSPRKTPKKTPIKSPRVKTRTPSSSAKKKLALRFRKVTGEIEKSVTSWSSENTSSKRALFKSPDKSARVGSRTMGISSSMEKTSSGRRGYSGSSEFNFAENDRLQLRRALFTSPRRDSPAKSMKSPLKQIFNCGDRKRKRGDSEDVQPSKFSRSMSVDLKSAVSNMNKSFTRTRSDMDILLNRSQSQAELSDIQKKKLQWAVYEALRTQNIVPGHAQFKIFASILARVTRRFFSTYANGASNIAGTSEKMLRIAKHHVFAVVKGKSLDEIVAEHLKNRARLQKPQGYIGLEEFNNLRNQTNFTTKEQRVLQDRANTIESWEKRKMEQLAKPESKLERIRKVINFGDDR